MEDRAGIVFGVVGSGMTRIKWVITHFDHFPNVTRYLPYRFWVNEECGVTDLVRGVKGAGDCERVKILEEWPKRK